MPVRDTVDTLRKSFFCKRDLLQKKLFQSRIDCDHLVSPQRVLHAEPLCKSDSGVTAWSDPAAEMPAVTETGLASMEKAVDQYETLQLRTLRMQERILATQDR